MNNTFRLPTGGTVRIKPELWETIQAASVEISVQLGRPIKESSVIMLLIQKALTETPVKDLVELLEEP